MKRKTTTRRRHSRQSVLQVRVMSPRIAWFGFLKLLGGIAKIACLLAVIVGIGWGVWRGIQQAFYKNPDFRLQVIDLNPNPVIDEIGVTEVGGIDLTRNPSLFDVDVEQLGESLRKRPEIADARVERHLPGTLVVRIIPRSPKAWISCPDGGLPAPGKADGVLVDHDGFAYPCPPLLVETAATLPVIHLPVSAEMPVTVGKKVKQPELESCFLLLDSARRADPESMHWIQSLRQANDWSLELVTRQGTCATFGLGDHARQIESLRTALDHAGEKGYLIQTINLIPKYNIPITLRDEGNAPRAIPVPEATPARATQSRRAKDLSNLLNRN